MQFHQFLNMVHKGWIQLKILVVFTTKTGWKGGGGPPNYLLVCDLSIAVRQTTNYFEIFLTGVRPTTK